MTKEELQHIADVVDLALCDALTPIPGDEDDASYYDGEKFAQFLAANGYKVVPIEKT